MFLWRLFAEFRRLCRRGFIRRAGTLAGCITLAIYVGFSCTYLRDHQTIRPYPAESAALPAEFELVCWNLGKGTRARTSSSGVPQALEGILGDEPEILCLQEALPRLVGDLPLGAEFARSFQWPLAPEPNGVMTLSTVTPQRARAVAAPSREAWIATPKMSLVTHHALQSTGGDVVTLLVVNTHALNFDVATARLAGQMEALGAEIRRHQGPVLVCGDFNTWRKDRLRVVRRAFAGLQEVPFPGGERNGAHWSVRLAGGDPDLPLDRVFYRDLELANEGGEVLEDVIASDHKPLRVRFRLPSPEATAPGLQVDSVVGANLPAGEEETLLVGTELGG